MTELTACPDPDCQAPAEIIDRWVWPSTSGPVEHRATVCVADRSHNYVQID